jgi:hypothetical protein
MSRLPDLPVPPLPAKAAVPVKVTVERSGPEAVARHIIAERSSGARKAAPGKARVDTDAVTATA